MSLVFYPKSHRYKLDGDWVPGVTTIGGVIDKSGPLISWSSGLVAEYVADNREVIEGLWLAGRDPLVAALKKLPEAARKRAAERGIQFHEYAERIMRGEEVDVPEEHVPLVESALAFFEDWKIEPVLIETSVASREYAYAGTLDLVADHGHGPRAIFDWKTGKAIYDSAAWQANGYGAAEFYGADAVTDGVKVTYQDERPIADLDIEEAWGVHIRTDGYDVHQLHYGPDVFEKFRLIRKLYDINKRARGDWKVPGSGYVGTAIQRRLEKEIA